MDFRSNPITDSNVVYFEGKEALNALVEKGAVLAKFHQTWCGHCKTMKKHFEKASTSFPKDGSIHFVDIDCGYHHVRVACVLCVSGAYGFAASSEST